MNMLYALILGIIEGLTEFLPISSTAHLILAGEWLRLPSSDFLRTFYISIQLGAILAVVVLYWKKIWSSRELALKVGAAFVPTAVIGFIFYRIVKDYLLDNSYIIAGALLAGGLLIIGLEKYYAARISATPTDSDNAISYRQAVLIGLFQSLAIIPGVSRAGATIIGGLGLGLKRREIVEFSFLLAIPTMLAASGWDIYKSRASLSALTTGDSLSWLLGFVSAFVTAIIGVKFFLRFIQKSDFRPFGWYRIILGLAVFAWLMY